MNQALPPQNTAAVRRYFVLEMLGFSKVEKELLTTTFRLTDRRVFCYGEAPAPEKRSDIYLVNADNPAGIQQLQARAPNAHAPAVLIGHGPVRATWPLVNKPIRWIRLFEELDQTMTTALQARERRQDAGDAKWDGTTFRRAVDRNRAPAPAFIPSAESVLVVDDSPTVRAFMRTRLAPFRLDVDYAENGEMAIEMTQAKNYTCIFLDVLMPGIDGYQVCKRIKSNPATKSTAVVMLSSKSSPFDKFRGNWGGCDAYLGKPASANELLTTIARFLPSARKVAQSILMNP